MAFLSSSNDFVVPYKIKDCTDAMKDAICTVDHFKLKSENLVAMKMSINVSPSMTSGTWGDVVEVGFKECQQGTNISITSTAKNLSFFGSAQQSKNVQNLTDAFTAEIEKYEKIPEHDSSNSVENKLLKLKDLYDKQLISNEEYEKAKSEALSQL